MSGIRYLDYKAQDADAAIGQLTRGCRVIGASNGRWSMVDCITQMLAATGPARVHISSWTCEHKELDILGSMIAEGRILTLRMMWDKSFPKRMEGTCRNDKTFLGKAQTFFGEESIRVFPNHMKIILARNAEWNLAARTSANLNMNPRFENYDIDDNAEICDYYERMFDELFTILPPGAGIGNPAAWKGFVEATKSPEVEGGLDMGWLAQ